MALVSEGKLDPSAIEAAAAAGSYGALLSGPESAGAAIAAGLAGDASSIPALIELIDDDGLAAKTATWALGRLDAEAALVSAIESGGLDLRENAYRALSAIAADGRASSTLADAMAARVEAELERAKGGRTGLGEHASRVLAVLGDERLDGLAQALIDGDPYTDRFELQRQRKALSDAGRDEESISDAALPWTEQFADDLLPPPVEAELDEAPVASEAAAADAAEPTPQPDVQPAPEADDLESPETDGEVDAAEAADDGEVDPEAPPPSLIDLEAFAASDEGSALEPQLLSLLSQVVPMLEQLSAQAVGVPLTDLSDQEIAAVFLQVLPQALPPQYLQALLSPQALSALGSLFKWLEAEGKTAEGAGLSAGISLVREQLQASMRQRGILGGPDYSEPE